MASSDIGVNTSNGPRSAIVTELGKEKKQSAPLWTQDDSMYTLCHLDDFKYLADMIEHIRLPLKVRQIHFKHFK